MSHLSPKNELNLDEKVKKFIEDIETLETEVKKIIDLQNSLLEGSSNLELKAKQIKDFSHGLARELFDFRELAVRLNYTYQILLQQLPKVNLSLTLEKFGLKQLILEDIALVVPILFQEDFGIVLSLLQVMQNREDHQSTSTSQPQNELEFKKILPLSNLQSLPKLSLEVKEIEEHDFLVQQLISE